MVHILSFPKSVFIYTSNSGRQKVWSVPPGALRRGDSRGYAEIGSVTTIIILYITVYYLLLFTGTFHTAITLNYYTFYFITFLLYTTVLLYYITTILYYFNFV